MSSFLLQLENLNISGDQIQQLSEKEIIRIEKILKAQVKTGGTIDINDVETILYTLKNNKEEIKTLFQSEYDLLRTILKFENRFHYKQNTSLIIEPPSERFSEFILKTFKKQIDNYINLCIADDNYNALNTFLTFKEILGVKICDEIGQKLLSKFNFGTECIDIDSSDLENRITPLCNPYFYRCCNKLGSFQFENAIHLLLNTVIKRLDNHKFLLRILFSMGEFNSSRSDINKVLIDNQNTAKKSGIKERVYTKAEKNKRGNSFFSVTSGHQDRNKQVKPNKKTGTKSGITIGTAGLILFIIIRVGLIGTKSYNSSRPNYAFKSTPMPRYYNSLNDTTSVRIKKEIAFLVAQFAYLQSNQLLLGSEKPLPPYIDPSLLYDSTQSKVILNNGGFELKNSSDQAMMLIIRTAKEVEIRFIHTLASTKLNKNIHGIHILTGKKPTLISYFDEVGDTTMAFRFKDFSYEDGLILKKEIRVQNNRNAITIVDLSIKNGQIKTKSQMIQANNYTQ